MGSAAKGRSDSESESLAAPDDMNRRRRRSARIRASENANLDPRRRLRWGLHRPPPREALSGAGRMSRSSW